MTEQNRQIFNMYLEDEKHRHIGRGLECLKRIVNRYITFIEEHDIEYRSVGIKEACTYQKWLLENGRIDGNKYKRKSIVSYVSGAWNFCEFLKRNKYIHTNPFREITRLKEEKRLPKNVLKEKDLHTLLVDLSKFEAPTLKQRITLYKIHVISELMYSTGLRISEVCNLKIEDIDFNRMIVKVNDGKGGKDRMTFLNEYAGKVLSIYIGRGRDIVFCQNNWENDRLLFGASRITLTEVVNRELEKLSKKHGFKKLTSHCFRHALGFHLLRAGCDIRYIQEILGHEKLMTTEVYTRVDKEDLKKILDKFHPRKFGTKTNE